MSDVHNFKNIYGNALDVLPGRNGGEDRVIYDQETAGSLFDELKDRHMEELEDEELARVVAKADEEVMVVMESINQIVEHNAVSLDMVRGVEHFLPKHLPLNSFTRIPTASNRDIVIESLSNGAKLAIGVGIVALLGGVAYYLIKMSQRKIEPPPARRMEAAKKLEEALTQMEKDIASNAARFQVDMQEAFDKMMADPNATLVLGEQPAGSVPDRTGLTDSLEQFLTTATEVAKSFTPEEINGAAKLNPLTVAILNGEYKFLINHGGEILKAVADLLDIMEKDVFSRIEKVAGAEEDDDGKEYDPSQLQAVTKRIDEIVKRWIHENPTLRKDNLASQLEERINNNEPFYSVFSADALFHTIAIEEGQKFEPSLMNVDLRNQDIVKMQDAQIRINKAASRIEDLKKVVEKEGIPRNVTAKFRSILDLCKHAVVRIDELFNVATHEIHAVNLATTLVGKVTVGRFRRLEDSFRRLREKSEISRSKTLQDIMKRQEEILLGKYRQVAEQYKGGM